MTNFSNILWRRKICTSTFKRRKRSMGFLAWNGIPVDIRNSNYVLFWPIKYSQLLQYVSTVTNKTANLKWCIQVHSAKYQTAVCILAAPVCIFCATGFWDPTESKETSGVCVMIEQPYQISGINPLPSVGGSGTVISYRWERHI